MSETQSLSFKILDNPQFTDVLFGGSAGGAKSFFVCLWAVMQCRNYEGIVIGLGRKELKRLKRTTLVTLLSKVHPEIGVKDHEFNYNAQSDVIQYVNGSKIILIDMAYMPSDPDYDKFGSLELTHVIIEEAGENLKKAVEVLGSRRNRMLNKEHGIVGKLVMTCNPTQNFLRQDYYKPYDDLGGGRYQQWQRGEVVHPETGERMPAYRAFVRSSVYDNPFVDLNYIETLKNLAPQERKRLLDGDWNYADDDDSLFPSLVMDRATVYDLPEQDGDSFDKFIGVDVADKGKDETIVTLIDRGVIITQKALDIGMTYEEMQTTDKPISYLYTDELIKFAQQNGFTAQQAKNIAIEGNGVGVGMRDMMKRRGWFATTYEATSTSRSEAYYAFYLDMDSGAVKMLNGLDDGELRRQLAVHTYEMDNQKPKVLKKDKVKLQLGRSPDQADSAMIANWCRRGGSKLTDSKKNANRIKW